MNGYEWECCSRTDHYNDVVDDDKYALSHVHMKLVSVLNTHSVLSDESEREA